MGAERGEGALLSFSYGNLEGVADDVDLFERFYAAHFKDEALAGLVRRTRRQSLALAVPLCLAGAALFVPPFVNAASIFAFILLAMGVGLLCVGLFFLVRFACAHAYCERRFDRLMEAEFAGTRTATKRIFDVAFFETCVRVSFGAQTAVKQTRVKRYEDVKGVYATDDLVFVKGLTWMARFQMGDGRFGEVCALLAKKCPDRFVDWRSQRP